MLVRKRKVLYFLIFASLLSFNVFSEVEIGAYLGEDPPTKGVINDFEDMVGKDIAGILFFQGWGEPAFLNPPSFPLSFLEENVRYHDGYDTQTIIHVTLEPWIDLAPLIRGDYDGLLKNYASQYKSWGQEIRFRFGHEMIHDDDPSTPGWYPWQDRPTQYVETFRHIHDIFQEVGANNVKFVWAPNWLPAETEILKKYYPGKEYVDWIGLDGYNSAGLWNEWVSFDEIFFPLYQAIIQNPDIFGEKPIMLAEFASAEGELKDEWILDAFQKIKEKYTKIEAFYWFNVDKEKDWRVNSSPQALSAFKEAIKDAYYTSHPLGGEEGDGEDKEDEEFVEGPVSIRVSATIPKISMLKVEISKIEGESWMPASEINFGTLVYDSQFGIFRAGCYYALDVGVFSNESSWHVTHTTSSLTNGIDTLDNHINVVFMKEVEGKDSVELGKFSFGKSRGVSFNKAQLSGGWLRIYYGIASGKGDVEGVKPITLAKSPGRYTGQITITLTSY